MRVTTHSRIRTRERFEITHHASVNKFLAKALTHGHKIDKYTGAFAEYLEHKKRRNKSTGIKVYDNIIILYRGRYVITVYEAPKRFVPTSNYLKCNGGKNGNRNKQNAKSNK